MAGCGNSRLTEIMFEDGYTTITNIDASRVVVDQMIENYRDKPTLQWLEMNVLSLDFPDETFNVVIAKGTVDAVLCGDSSIETMAKLCSEVSRVLKPNGCFFIITYGVPENRLFHLEKDIFNWDVTVHTVPKPAIGVLFSSLGDLADFHFIYVCSKRGGEPPRKHELPIASKLDFFGIPIHKSATRAVGIRSPFIFEY